MTIKELIKAKLENLSEEDLQEFYQLLKSRSQRQKENQDELGTLLEKYKINTGIPIEINKEGKLLLISPIQKTGKLQNLVYRPQVIQGNPDDLVNIGEAKMLSCNDEEQLKWAIFNTSC